MVNIEFVPDSTNLLVTIEYEGITYNTLLFTCYTFNYIRDFYNIKTLCIGQLIEIHNKDEIFTMNSNFDTLVLSLVLSVVDITVVCEIIDPFAITEREKVVFPEEISNEVFNKLLELYTQYKES